MTGAFAPFEFILIGFEGNHFTGDITPALADLVADGLIRLVDVAVVVKDADGTVSILEMQELSAEAATAMRELVGDVRGLLSEEDLLSVAQSLEPSSSVAALLVEHLWAHRFADAVRASGGELLMAERIPGDIVDAARSTLLAANPA